MNPFCLYLTGQWRQTGGSHGFKVTQGASVLVQVQGLVPVYSSSFSSLLWVATATFLPVCVCRGTLKRDGPGWGISSRYLQDLDELLHQLRLSYSDNWNMWSLKFNSWKLKSVIYWLCLFVFRGAGVSWAAAGRFKVRVASIKDPLFSCSGSILTGRCFVEGEVSLWCCFYWTELNLQLVEWDILSVCFL